MLALTHLPTIHARHSHTSIYSPTHSPSHPPLLWCSPQATLQRQIQAAILQKDVIDVQISTLFTTVALTTSLTTFLSTAAVLEALGLADRSSYTYQVSEFVQCLYEKGTGPHYAFETNFARSAFGGRGSGEGQQVPSTTRRRLHKADATEEKAWETEYKGYNLFTDPDVKYDLNLFKVSEGSVRVSVAPYAALLGLRTTWSTLRIAMC